MSCLLGQIISSYNSVHIPSVTWRSLGTYPASTAARVAPTVQPESEKFEKEREREQKQTFKDIIIRNLKGEKFFGL